jgi:uncharacterized tellurite resistance protein B-like protein
MLKAVAQFIASLAAGESPSGQDYDEVQLSAAALIVRLAKVDGAFSSREEAWLKQAVESYTGLSGDEAERFLDMADQVARESDDLAASVEVLRRRLPPDQRLSLVALLWRMALADGVLHEFEEALIARIADLLDLSPAEAEAIRDAELQR